MVQPGRDSRLRRRVEHVLDVVGTVAAHIGLAPVASWLARPLLLAPDIAPRPAIVVLCGGCRFSGHLNEATCARVAYGVRLFREDLSTWLVLSGGRHTPARPNCALRMKTLAIELGAPPARILVEDRSSRTAENAREVARVLRATKVDAVLLVTGPLHMRRARRCFERQGIAVSCAPVPYMSQGSLLVKEVVHEYLGLAYYTVRNWV